MASFESCSRCGELPCICLHPNATAMSSSSGNLRGGQETSEIEPRGDDVPAETAVVHMPIWRSTAQLAESMRRRRFLESETKRNRQIMSDNNMASGESSSICVVPYIGVDLNPFAMSSSPGNLRGYNSTMYSRDIRGGQESLEIEPRGDEVREVDDVPAETDGVHMPRWQFTAELAESMRGRRILESSSRFGVPYIGVDLNPIGRSSKECKTNVIEPRTRRDHVVRDLDNVPVETALKELNPSQPEKKRPKFEARKTEFYKRCNCKKSKCMKLYCDCFAIGAYCGETCSCIDCFNKLVHKNEVMTTRKKIESRNPFAFDPKIIKSPVSARHKRGCNCRKSKCFKKYCECYQGGVGCSRNCSCEGCNNMFGRRDG